MATLQKKSEKRKGIITPFVQNDRILLDIKAFRYCKIAIAIKRCLKRDEQDTSKLQD